MGDFSISPVTSLADNLAKGYVGVHLQQGVPLRDQDLNLLGDLVLATARIVAAGYIGSGIAAGRDGFQVTGGGATNDFAVLAGPEGTPGTCLVDGIEVWISAPTDYDDQDDVEPLTAPTPAQPDPRTDIVYLDVWLADVESDVDPDLENAGDVGMQTATRIKPQWRVRVAEGSDVGGAGLPMPDPEVGHSHYPLARLTRPRNVATISAAMVTDLRQRNLTVSDLEARVRSLEQLVVQPRLEDGPGLDRPFNPPLGAPGSTVHIFGQNLRVGTTQVLFGAVPSSEVDPMSDTEITAKVPAMPGGAVTITVTTAGGSVTSEDTFSVLEGPPAGPPPTLAAPPGEFSPPVGAAPTVVTINGTGFDQPGLELRFGTSVAANPIVTATTIKVPVPAGPPAALRITVRTDFGEVTSTASFNRL